MEDYTDDEDATTRDDSCAPSEPVCERTSEEGTKEGTCGQYGNNERLLPGLVETAIVRVSSVGRTCDVSFAYQDRKIYSLPNCCLKAFIAKTPLM